MSFKIIKKGSPQWDDQSSFGENAFLGSAAEILRHRLNIEIG